MPLTKVLLVSPNQFKEPYPVYPLALSYLKSYLEVRCKKLRIELFDFNIADLEEFKKKLQDFQPELVGISLRNIDTVNMHNELHFVKDCHDLIKEVKKYPDTLTVLGGAGFSIFPEAIFEQLQPDYGIFGEGEETLYQLIQALKNDNEVARIEGLIFRSGDRVVMNRRKSYCQDPELVFDNHLVDFYWNTAGMLNLQTKRGCPYNCIYCTYPLIDGNNIRTQNPEKIVDSLIKLNKDKGISYFFFTDSVFNIHNSYNGKLAEAIIESGLNIQWGAYFTPHKIDKPMLKLLKRSGLTHLEFGTESLSNSTLKAYNKNFLIDDILHTSRLCNELELFSAHFLIIGGPGESDQSVEETLVNSNRMQKTVFFPFFGMRIYPGTGVYDLAVAQGKIKQDESILQAVYYLTDGLNYDSIKKRAKNTANRWIFPDEDLRKPIEMMRKKGIKGPLWEMLIK